MSACEKRKVVLIGWDAADWQIISPLLDQGKMPALQSLVDRGVVGNVSTLMPVLSPALWNTVATGKRAYKHGIFGFVEPRSDGSGIKSVSSTSRKCKALWNILSQSSLTSNVVNWFASYPAEPIHGVCVSDHFNNLGIGVDRTQSGNPPANPLAVHPQQLAPSLAELRVHPDQISPHHLLPFVPLLTSIPAESTGPITGLRKMLAKCATTHAIATELLEHHPADFTAIYYETIDHVCHGFMPYHPPRVSHVPVREYEWFKDVVAGIYRYHDMMLHRILELAGDDATIIVLSDHGFINNELRPVEPADKTPVPEAWHRSHGICVMAGPGIARDERIYGASLLDIAPTILTMFDLPVGRDMDGKVLVHAFSDPPIIERIESWEAVDGNSGQHPADLRVDPFEQQEALKQLAELGYIGSPDEPAAIAIRRVTVDAMYNQAVSLYYGGELPRAAAIFEKLHVDNREAQPRMEVGLAQCYIGMGRFKEARELLSVTDRATVPQEAHSRMLLASIAAIEGNDQDAAELLKLAETAEARFPTLSIQIADTYSRFERWDDAMRAYEKAFRMDDCNADAAFGIGACAFKLKQFENSADYLLRAVGLQHHMPRAHYLLGLALLKLGMLDRAAMAISTSLSMDSRHVPLIAAHRHLYGIYSRLGKADLAVQHRVTSKNLANAVRLQSRVQT